MNIYDELGFWTASFLRDMGDVWGQLNVWGCSEQDFGEVLGGCIGNEG